MDPNTPSSPPSLSEEAIDRLPLGQVVGDFLPRTTFWKICQEWLAGSNFRHVVTLNPEMVVEAERNEDFRAAVSRADLRIPDGTGLIWAQWYIRSEFWALLPSLLAFSFRHVERIQGVEVVEHLASLCTKQQKLMYLLGGTSSQVNGTAEQLRKRFPGLEIAVSGDHAFDIEGPEGILADIQNHAPAVLLVAYGAPKQTLWIERHRGELPTVRIAVGVGGAFAILSEEKSRAPSFLRRLNMEWLWRLILEPSRLPRIWQAVVTFPHLIRQQKMRTYSH